MALVAHALTTVNRLKDYLELSSLTSTQEIVMTNIINSVTSFIESYTGRRFMKTVYTNEVYDGPYDERLVLNHFPVISSEAFSLQVKNSADNTDDWESIEASKYFVKHDSGEVYSTGRSDFILSVSKYRVNYTAGYDFNNTTTFLSDTAAGDVEFACWMLASEIWHQRKGSPNIQSERLGDYSISYGKGGLSQFFTNGSGQSQSMVQAILDKYISPDVVGTLSPRIY